MGSLSLAFGQKLLTNVSPKLAEKRCILTITRPNGVTRSYATDYAFSRQKEAKNEVARLALSLGAEAFINGGDDSKAKGMKLAPVNLPPGAPPPEDEDPQGQTKPTSDDDVDDESQPPIAEINNCCTTWRAGRVRPKWYYTIDGSGQCVWLECLPVALLTE